MRFITLLAIAAPLVVSAQTVHKVVVGSSKGQTIFTPEAIGAVPGDIVSFEFQQKNHSIVQSSFANPCGKLDGGLNSGFMPVPPEQTSDFPVWNITVPDEKPIWLYCSQKNPKPHCGLGMVFAVNCGPTGAPNSFDNFKSAALAQGAAFDASASAAPAASSTASAPPYGATAPPDDASTVVATITLESSTWTTTYASYPNSPNPTPASLEGVTHNVVVGDNGTLTFDPPHIAASVRDKVIFTFKTKNHTVTQSTFGSPCLKKVDAATGAAGFDSGFMPVEAGSSDFPTYTLTVNDTAPIWLYCRQKNPVSHCSKGMVFAINTDETANSQKTYAMFANLATQQNATDAPATSGNSSDTGPGSGASAPPPGGNGAMSLSVASALGFFTLAACLTTLL